MLTYTLVNVTWVFFRAKTFGKAWSVLRGMAGAEPGREPLLSTFYLTVVAVIVAGSSSRTGTCAQRTLESVLARTPPLLIGTLWGLMLFAIVAAQGDGSAFIYFQF